MEFPITISMSREPQEIQNAILKLERNLKNCAPYDCFGNDNRRHIIIMLDVIKNRRLKVWINSTYLTTSEMFHEQPDNPLWQCAIDAKDWLDGKFAIEELLFGEVQLSSHKLFEGINFNR